MYSDNKSKNMNKIYSLVWQFIRCLLWYSRCNMHMQLSGLQKQGYKREITPSHQQHRQRWWVNCTCILLKVLLENVAFIWNVPNSAKELQNVAFEQGGIFIVPCLHFPKSHSKEAPFRYSVRLVMCINLS